jgi:8-oxo-dGTP diphosphatase
MNGTIIDRLWRLALWCAYRMLLCYWFLFRPRSGGVYVAVWCGSRILIIRNSYRAWYNFPCGGQKLGESPLAAAARELGEEAGIKVEPEDLIHIDSYSSTREYRRDRSTLYELRLESEPNVEIDRREVVWASFMEAEEARALDLADIPDQYLAMQANYQDNLS